MSREMRHSGIEWISEIPKEWKVIPFKQMYGLGKGLSITKTDLVEEGIPVISYGQIHSKANTGTTIKDELIRFVPGEFLDDNASSLVKKGDVIFADTSEDLDGCGNCVYIDRDITIFAGYHTIIAKYQSTDPNNYLSYLFKTDCWRSQIRSSVNGVKLFSVPQRLLGKTTIILPPLSEQQKIACYLDKVCGEVDEMIALQEQMIEELKAYKQSVITEAVTKGLNPNIPLKDSGIDWIGEIPKRWRISKIKMIAKTNSGSTPRNISNSDDSDIIWVRTTDINDDMVNDSSIHLTQEEFSSASCPMLDKGACVVAMYGGGGTIGKSGFLNVRATINQALCSMEVNNSYHDKYLFCVLKAIRYYWMKYAVGTRKDPNISQEIVRNMFVPMPSLSEQLTIASYLDTKSLEIDALIAIKQAKIEELKEYKKSIIYEYVTGKKEVV